MDYLLLETGDHLVLEDGTGLLLLDEQQPQTSITINNSSEFVCNTTKTTAYLAEAVGGLIINTGTVDAILSFDYYDPVTSQPSGTKQIRLKPKGKVYLPSVCWQFSFQSTGTTYLMFVSSW